MNKTACLFAVLVAVPLVACAAESSDSSSEEPSAIAPRKPKSSSTEKPSDTATNEDAGAPVAEDASTPTDSDAGAIDPADLPGAPSWTAPFMPPMSAHQAKCSAAQIDDWLYCSTTDWLGTECKALASTTCISCIETSSGSSAWGPVVYTPSNDLWFNNEGCLASVAGSTACASKVYAANVCLSRCSSAKNHDACVAYARTHVCQTPITNAESCAKASGMVGDVKYAPCGDPMPGLLAESVPKSLITYFCGQ